MSGQPSLPIDEIIDQNQKNQMNRQHIVEAETFNLFKSRLKLHMNI